MGSMGRFIESDLVWSPSIHTPTKPFTEVVDRSAAVSFLAAGRVGHCSTTETPASCGVRNFARLAGMS